MTEHETITKYGSAAPGGASHPTGGWMTWILPYPRKNLSYRSRSELLTSSSALIRLVLIQRGMEAKKNSTELAAANPDQTR